MLSGCTESLDDSTKLSFSDWSVFKVGYKCLLLKAVLC